MQGDENGMTDGERLVVLAEEWRKALDIRIQDALVLAVAEYGRLNVFLDLVAGLADGSTLLDYIEERLDALEALRG